MEKVIIGLLGGIMLGMATQANATAISGPGLITEVGSWNWSRWYEDGAVLNADGIWGNSQFDQMTLTLVSGAPFEVSPSGLINWGTGGWAAATSAGGTFVSATGPLMGGGNNLYYDFHLGGSSTQPLEFYYSIWKDGNLLTIQDFKVNIDGSTSYAYLTPETEAFVNAAGKIRSVAVPDGGLTAALLGMGMFGLGWVRRMVK